MFNKFNNILKIDYGVQIRSNIVDAACYSESQDLRLIESKEAVLSVIPNRRPKPQEIFKMKPSWKLYVVMNLKENH